MTNTIYRQLILVSVVFGAMINANASIIGFDSAQITSPSIIEDFDSGSLTNPTTWIGDDLTVTDNGAYADFYDGAVGGVDGLYQNGGSHGHIGVTLNSGAAFGGVQFDLGNGFGANPQFVWVRTLNDGLFTGFEFDFDTAAPGTISILSAGTDFDEIQLWVSNSSVTRDGHSLTMSSAASIDNIKVGTVPEPNTLILLTLGMAGLGYGRKSKKLRA
jgi:hypothetical protein